MITIEEIKTEIISYNPRADIAAIDKAYEYSSRAHAGQMRKSGDPYLIHPVEVAKIITQLKMDTASVVAAILHDTIEDTSTTKKDIEKEFGNDVAEIVDGVTKIGKLQFRSLEDRQAENYRKMILAMSRDIRVILVKLADRLNNMRTLQFMAEARQIAIAQETLDIYVPLAARMGIQWIKEELENHSLRYLKPEMHRQIDAIVKSLEKNRQEYINGIRDSLKKNLEGSIPKIEIQGRIKQVYSIYQKMIRSQVGIDEIHDLIAFRVLVPSMEHCYEALGDIHALFKPIPGRFKDYIAMPKPNNYQSLHTTVIAGEGERIEFQIRTFEMHEVAELGVAAHWKYKEDGKLDTKDESKFRWLRQLVDWQRELSDSLEFVDTMKLDLFAEEIYVFTPKGDVKNLARGATPIDFAFAVHSGLGLKCTGARVNGRMVPLATKLDSGDTVEIITAKNHQPSKDWLDFAVTSRARTHIRQFIRTQQREKSISIGRGLFEAECVRNKVTIEKTTASQEFRTYLESIKQENEEAYFTQLAFGNLLAADYFKAHGKQASDKDQENIIRRIFRKIGSRNRNLIQVDNADDVLVTFGKCCTPLFGDAIIGYVTRGRGVVVHRSECPKIIDSEPERRVGVAWNQSMKEPRPARVKVVSEDRKGMLADITRVIAEHDVSIVKVLVKISIDGMATISLDLQVSHRDDLYKLLKELENIKGLIQAEREINV